MLIQPEETNAYSAYRKVLELDPQNRTANQGLETILTSLLDEVRTNLDNGNMELAGTQVQNVDTLFPNMAIRGRRKESVP